MMLVEERFARSYFKARGRCWEAARRFFAGMNRSEPAAARARDAFRRDAQQEQTAAGMRSRDGE